jgi:DNA polymerase
MLNIKPVGKPSKPLRDENEIDLVAESIRGCKACELHQTRRNAVPGDGPPSWIMFVGEAPGSNEDSTGKPFVGSAGKFLGELLSVAGLAREDVFITNVLKCRPPSNRNPRTAEVSACIGHLNRQMEVIRPRLVCVLGSIALRYLLGKGSITQARGTPVLRNGILYFPTLHPAATLYDRSKKEVLIKDFESLGLLVKNGPEGLLSNLARLQGLRSLDSF